MKDILTTYEVVPGQAISLPKFEIYYSSAVEQHMHGREVLGTGKYLGLPYMVG